MDVLLLPWHLFAAALASLLTEEQSRVIAYLKAENAVLREQLKGRGGRVRFTDEQRRRLAAAAKDLGRRLLRQLDTLVTPDTLLRWHRELIARKYDGSANRNSGRPRIRQELEALVVRIATESPRWGYERIRGELFKLGHSVARTTVANVLARHGIEPAPRRGAQTRWKDFLKAHWDILYATDFFTVEVWSAVGLIRYHVLVVINLKSRRVELGGIIHQPYGEWMAQMGRKLTDGWDGFIEQGVIVLCDRDPLFGAAFREVLKLHDVALQRLPPRSPNLNAYVERFVLSIKSECLGRLILFSEKQLRHTVDQYIEHYHQERPHQGLGNHPLRGRAAANEDGEIHTTERHGGLLRAYGRAA